MEQKMFLLVFSVAMLMTVNGASQNETAQVKFVDCPAGNSVTRAYIQAGTYATCTCKKLDASQTGQLVWYELLDNNVVQVSASHIWDNSSVLEINTDKRQMNQSLIYLCRIEDGSVYSVGLSFQPKIAYGPDYNALTMTPEINSNWIFDLCPGGSKDMTILCEVPMASVNPMPTLWFHVITDNQEEHIDMQPNFTVVDTKYRFARTVRLDSSHAYRVICSLSNSVFPQLNQALSHDISVREPPTSMPTFTISTAGNDGIVQNGSKVSVNGNSHITVTCIVRGGTPEVSSVFIVCNKNINTGIGTSTSLDFDVTEASAIVCSCEANHTSGCYNYKSVIEINGVYQASVLNFTANSLSDTLTIDSGSEIRFECHANGNPVPRMSLVQSDRTTLKQAQGLEIAISYKNVQCGFTNRYYCVVRNGLETSIELPQRSIDVYVKCFTTLKDARNQDMKVEVEIAKTATVIIQVKGYPAPNSYVLTIPKSNYDLEVNQSKYSVSYKSGENGLPSVYGVITLNIKDITREDLVAYKFKISNGGQLTFSFTLIEAITNNTIYIAAGVTSGILLLVIALIVVIILYRRNINKARKSPSDDLYNTPDTPKMEDDYIYANISSVESVCSSSGTYIVLTDSNETEPNGKSTMDHWETAQELSRVNHYQPTTGGRGIHETTNY